MKWIGEIKTIGEYIESLREQAKQLHEARHEKYRGGWNYESYDRHAMAAEETLFLKIASELVQFRELNPRPSTPKSKSDHNG